MKESLMMYSQWTIGWRTPTLIVALYLLAFALATGHFTFFQYLDGRALNDSLPQGWVSSISTAFVVCFSSSLGGSLGTAFSQRLWQLYRNRPMKLSTIDLLYTARYSPASLLNPNFLASAKLEWVFVLACWCVPIVSIFPPGGIRVVAEGRNTTRISNVPTFNPSYQWPKADGGNLENQTAVRMQGLFKLADDGDYIMPLAEIASPVKMTLLRGQYLTIPTPCGQNCSYSISFPGPSFKCKDTGVKMPNEFPGYSSLSNLTFESYDFIGTENTNPAIGALKTYNSSVMGFEVGYSFKTHSGGGDNGLAYQGMKSINCSTWLSTYNLDISFRGGVQETKVKLKDNYIFNATSITRRWQFGPSGLNVTMFASDVSGSKPGHATLFLEMQARAIRDAVVTPLLGEVLDFNSEIPRPNRTMILETPWAPNPKIYTWNPMGLLRHPLVLSVTPRILEDMLVNATISTLAMGNWTTNANATVEHWTNYYRFDREIYVLAPYGVALLVALLFLCVGMAALVSNGVPAEDGSFLQVACTTGGNETLDHTLAGGCLGGVVNMNRDVDQMKFIYGELKMTKGDGQGLVKRAGFGLVDEVTTLKKGALYGVYQDEPQPQI